YKQIGNAVPVGLGKAIGRSLRRTMRAGRAKMMPKEVVCANADLAKRIARRPKTILNPIRMRKIKATSAAIAWLNGSSGRRVDILKYVEDTTKRATDDPSVLRKSSLPGCSR